ncbi:MAG TPA: ATPase, T2SS/T4P/T4SS family [Candidatus Saccharimonadales bacterium]|nr:ATPase, T2SS/T4P/T4SS family [Candidatus Saccharimonadales bacterium]
MGAKDGLMGRLLGSADKFSDKQIRETLMSMVEYGVKRGASDIHIEPHERSVLVRYRIDGTLRGIHKLPKNALNVCIAQAKALADLNVQQTELPQEGHYTMTIEGKEVEVRITTMPIFGGEKAVLHLSMHQGKPHDLAALGFWGAGLSTLQTVLANPYGLVVVAAPRHHGGSSTLFSLLDQINSPLVSIATVELRPKHRLPGVSQTYLSSSNMTMHEGLQAALKQDPNVVMLSTVTDGATAGTAVQAAATGHLILAGLHAENSSAALLSLRAAGVEPFLLVTTVRAAVGQRLVRKLCPECRERYTVSDEEWAELVHYFGMSAASARKRVHELERAAAPAIFGDVKQLGSTPTRITHLWRPGKTGCSTCDHTGYQGRTAIVEVQPSTEALHKALLNRDIISAAALQAVTLKDGFVPLTLDGLIKALRGQTTAAEVLRVSKSIA